MKSETGIAKSIRYFFIIGVTFFGLLSIIATSGNKPSGSDTPTWAKSYGGSGDDEASVIRETSDGGQIFAGTWNGQPLSGRMREGDIWVLKSDVYGDIEWQRSFGEHLLVPEGESSDSVYYHIVREANDGGAWLVGSLSTDYREYGQSQYLVPHSSDLLVAKLTPTGQEQWVKAYDSGAYPNYDFFYQGDKAAETGWDIWPTSDGGAIVAAEVDVMVLEDAHAVTAIAVYVMKVNADGEIIWSRHITEDQFAIEVGNLYGDFDGRRNYRELHVRETADGGAVVATAAEIPDGDDVRVTKLDTSGIKMWTRAYDVGVDIYDIIQTDDDGDGQSDDGFMLAGYSTENFIGRSHGLILKLNADGTQDWDTRLDQNVRLKAVTERSFINQVGFAVRTYCTIEYDFYNYAMRIYTIDPDGEVQNSIEVPDVDSAYQVRYLADTDSYEVLGGAGNDLWIGTFDFNLSVTSQRTVASTLYDSRGDGYPFSYSMAFTQSDDILEVSSVDVGQNVVTRMEHLFRRLGADGSVVWEKSMGSSDERVEKALDILETDDGYLIVGSSTSFASDDREIPRLWLVKIDKDADIDWQKTFENINAYSIPGARISNIVQQTSDGGYVLCGEVDNKVRLLKLDTNGDEEWISSPITEEYELSPFFAIQQMNNGNFVITGQYRGNVQDRALIAIRDATGEALSQYSYPGVNPTSIHELDDGFIVGGFLESDSDTPMAMKLNSAGEVVWSKTFEVYQSYSGYTVRVEPTSDGGFILGTSGIDTLSRNYYEAGQEPRYITSGRWNFQIMKLDVDGVVQWCRIYGGLYDEYLYDMRVFSDDTIIAAGATKTMADTSQAWVIKLGPDGMLEEGCNAYLEDDFPVWTETLDITMSQMTAPATGPTLSLQVTDTMITSSSPENVEVARQCSGWANSGEGPDQGTEHTAPQFTYSPLDPNVGDSVSFDASASMDGENIDTFEWDFDYDDTIFNSISSGVTVTHTYNTAGSFTVRLRITYDDGFQGETEKIIHVTDGSTAFPDAGFSMTPAPATANMTVMYDASASTGQDGQNATISTYQWDFDGDGTWDQEGDGTTAKITYYVYNSADTYTVTLKVTDTWGGEDETSQQLVVNVSAGTDTNPPVWSGEIIEFVGTEPGSIYVEWGIATDVESPPVTYLVYLDTVNPPWDATPVEKIPAQLNDYYYNFSGLAAGTYYVGVRAHDNADPPNIDQNNDVEEIIIEPLP